MSQSKAIKSIAVKKRLPCSLIGKPINAFIILLYDMVLHNTA